MEKTKKQFNPIWFLIIGIFILVVPSAIYLGFLIPSMKEEYVVLLSSGGCIGGAGTFGATMIPDKTKYGTLYKTASKSFTMLVVVTLIKDFIAQIIGLIAVAVVSYILFIIFKELWSNGKRRRENKELATEITRGITEASK